MICKIHNHKSQKHHTKNLQVSKNEFFFVIEKISNWKQNQIPNPRPNNGKKWKFCKIHLKNPSRKRNNLPHPWNKSPNQCRFSTIFLKIFFRLIVVINFQKHKFSVFFDKFFENRRTEIKTDEIIYSRTKPRTSRPRRKCKPKTHLSLIRKRTSGNHRHLGRKRHKTRFNRHHHKNPQISHLFKNPKNIIYKIVHKNFF